MLAEQILASKGHDVATVSPTATVADALGQLAEHNVGALVVSDDGTHVGGIISERDIVRRLASDGQETLALQVAELMQAEVATIGARTDTEHIMSVMTEGRFRHIPVVEDDQLCGIISIGDVVKARISELATEKDQLVGYIRSGR